ncbi:type II toxin-antitoxin system PemK/MazF family toxin [Methylocystis sp.]
MLLDQIRAIDKQRLVKRLGKASESTLSAILAGLREVFED